MKDPFSLGIGAVVSADIAVPEHEREMRFYARVLSTGLKPLWREDLLNNRGMPVIGLGARNAGHAELPLQWMPHIQVSDVAASVERARTLGGSELMHGKNDDGERRWAVLVDPNGAAFGVIPVVSAEELPPTGDASASDGSSRVGCISWLELIVSDAPAARDFYRDVVKWTVRDVDLDETGEGYADYDMLDESLRPAARVRHVRDTKLGLPPVWLIHLPVGDLTESLRRVEEEGGEVVHATRGSDGAHAYAVIRDPVGACLALVAA